MYNSLETKYSTSGIVEVLYTKFFFEQMLLHMQKEDLKFIQDEVCTVWHITDVTQLLLNWKEPNHGTKYSK